jgi:membrane protein YqaA with SNARE-associated domain
VHRFFVSIFRLFLSPGGILILGALDSTLIFFLPAAIDTAVIVMAARQPDWFWAFPLLASAGSIVGIAITFAMGSKIGEAGLQYWAPKSRIQQFLAKIGTSGVMAMGATALLPPPFPLTPFVLTGGALGVDKRKFFTTVAAMRILRFGIEGTLAFFYGRHIVRWLRSDVFEYAVSGLMILALTGTAVSIVYAARRRK